MAVNLYLFLEPVHLNLSRQVQDQYFRCVNKRQEFVIKRTCTEVKKFLFHPAGSGYFWEVLTKRFSTAGSGAQLSGKITLEHAHSPGFAHRTATFDPSIHTSIERPTRWYQHEKHPPTLRVVVGLARLVSS
jgi:hypothetical protein